MDDTVVTPVRVQQVQFSTELHCQHGTSYAHFPQAPDFPVINIMNGNSTFTTDKAAGEYHSLGYTAYITIFSLCCTQSMSFAK